MDRFRCGEIQVLVCTSVIEVGVDVPNATLMTIEDGHRFGLAQLIAPRGRISRGQPSGVVLVFGDPQSDESRGCGRSWPRRRLQTGRDRLQAPRAGRSVWHEATWLAGHADCRSIARRSDLRKPDATPKRSSPIPASRERRQTAPHDAGALRQGVGVGRRGMRRPPVHSKGPGVEFREETRFSVVSEVSVSTYEKPEHFVRNGICIIAVFPRNGHSFMGSNPI